MTVGPAHTGERGPGAAALTIPSQGEARDRAFRDPGERGGYRPLAADCPDCRSAGSVIRGFCQVCYADRPAPEQAPEEPGTSAAADLPPAAGGPVASLRFADVIDELRAAAHLATEPGAPESVSAACRRLEALLEALRLQFLADVGLAGPSLADPVPAG